MTESLENGLKATESLERPYECYFPLSGWHFSQEEHQEMASKIYNTMISLGCDKTHLIDVCYSYISEILMPDENKQSLLTEFRQKALDFIHALESLLGIDHPSLPVVKGQIDAAVETAAAHVGTGPAPEAVPAAPQQETPAQEPVEPAPEVAEEDLKPIA